MADPTDFHARVTADNTQLNREMGESQYGVEQLLNTFVKLEAQMEKARKANFAPLINQIKQAQNAGKGLERALTQMQRGISLWNSRVGMQGLQNPVSFAQNPGSNPGETLALSRFLRDSYTVNTPGAIEAQFKKHAEALDRMMMAQTDALMAARRKRYQAALNTELRRSQTAGLYEARQTLTDRADQQAMRRAQIGDAAYSWERRREHLNAGGGAELVGVQSRILVGYQALSGAFNIARNMSTFIVGLDREFKQFQAITNTTSEEMKSVRNSLIEVSEATKFTALEVAEAATILGQAGMSSQNVRESIEAITLLATAAGTNLQEAVQNVTSTLSIFNLQAEQATAVANTMTAALNGSKLAMEQITLGLQYAGNTAAQLGVTYQELIASFGAMANSGIKSGSTLGTGMRQILTSLEAPTSKFVTQLEKVGLSLSDVDVKSRGILPVLQTMRDAGFGASEAYQAFEIRAAAAFAAMANNLDLAVELEESFYKSTAAIEANITQMESLTNTWDKFKSVMGTIAYEAFAPTIGVLQKFVDTLAESFTGLRQMPGVLQAIGAAAAGMGGMLASALAFTTVRGIGKSIFSFQGVTEGMQEVGIEADRAGRRVGILNKALTGFSLFLRANFITAGIGAALALGSLFQAWGDRATEAEKNLAKLEAATSRSKQSFDTLRQEASAIDQTISNLQARQNELDQNPIQRGMMIDQVLTQFTELNGSIDRNRSSIAELIESLNELKSFNLEAQAQDLSRLTSETSAQILAEQNIRGDRDIQDDMVKYFRARIIDPTGERGAYRDRLDEASRWDSIIPELTRSDFETSSWRGAGTTVLRGLADPRNADQVEGFSDSYTALSSIIARMEQVRLSNDGQLSPEMQKMMDWFVELRDSAKGTYESVLKQEALQRTSVQLEEQNTRLLNETSVHNVMGPTGGALVTNLVAATQGPLNTIGSPQSGLQENYQAMEELKTAISEARAAYETYIDDIVEQTGLSRDIVESGFGSSTAGQNFNKKLIELETKLNERRDELGDGDVKYAEEQLKRTEKQLTEARRSRGRARTLEEFDRAASEVNRLEASAIAERKRLLDAQTNIAEDQVERERIFTSYLDQHNADAAARSADVAAAEAQRNKLEHDRYDTLITTANARVAEIEAEIEKLTQDLGKADSPEAVGKLKSAIDELFTQLAQAIGWQGSLLRQQAEYADPNAGGTSFYAKMGISESSNNFGAVQSRTGAVGRMQFMDSRLQDFRNANPQYAGLTRGQFQASPAIQREAEMWHFRDLQNHITQRGYLQRYGGQTIGGAVVDMGALMGVGHLGGTGGISTFLAGRGHTVHDGTAEKPGTTLNDYARKFSGTDVSLARFYGDTEALSRNAADAELAAYARITNLSRDRAVRDGNLSLDGILSQAQLSRNPAEIQALLAQADGTATGLIQKQLEAFDETADPSTPEANSLARLQLEDSLIADRDRRISEMLQEYNRAVDTAVLEPLAQAQARLSAAERSGNYSESELQGLRNEVTAAEQAEAVNQLRAAEDRLKVVREQLNESTRRYGAESQSAIFWSRELAAALEEERQATERLNLEREAEGHRTLGGAREQAFNDWKMGQSHFINEKGNLRSEEEQMKLNWLEALDAMSSGAHDFFMSLSDGWEGVAQGAKNFGLQVIKMLQQMIARAMAFQLIMGLFGQGGKFPGFGSSVLGLGTVNSIPGMMNGGLVTGGIPGRDSVLRRVEPGEMILRRSAVAAIGEDNLIAMNNLGGAHRQPNVPAYEPARESDKTVNVYVVSPEQKPQMTPNDVLVTLTSDMQQRGASYKLVKSIQMGQI